MHEEWMPPLRLQEVAGRCRLSFGSWAHGEGSTLQEAADNLIMRLGDVALSVRRGGFRLTSETPLPDRRVLEYLWELGELAARGEDLRTHVFA